MVTLVDHSLEVRFSPGAHGLLPVGPGTCWCLYWAPLPLSSQSLYLFIPSGLRYSSPSSRKPSYPSRTGLKAPISPFHSISALIHRAYHPATTWKTCDSSIQPKIQTLSSIDKSCLKRCTWREILHLRMDCFLKYLESIPVCLLLPPYAFHSFPFSLPPNTLSISRYIILLCSNYKPVIKLNIYKRLVIFGFTKELSCFKFNGILVLVHNAMGKKQGEEKECFMTQLSSDSQPFTTFR